jgi:hypothetical protein
MFGELMARMETAGSAEEFLYWDACLENMIRNDIGTDVRAVVEKDAPTQETQTQKKQVLHPAV